MSYDSTVGKRKKITTMLHRNPVHIYLFFIFLRMNKHLKTGVCTEPGVFFLLRSVPIVCQTTKLCFDKQCIQRAASVSSEEPRFCRIPSNQLPSGFSCRYVISPQTWCSRYHSFNSSLFSSFFSLFFSQFVFYFGLNQQRPGWAITGGGGKLVSPHLLEYQEAKKKCICAFFYVFIQS